jgi:hypothetical protein
LFEFECPKLSGAKMRVFLLNLKIFNTIDTIVHALVGLTGTGAFNFNNTLIEYLWFFGSHKLSLPKNK